MINSVSNQATPSAAPLKSYNITESQCGLVVFACKLILLIGAILMVYYGASALSGAASNLSYSSAVALTVVGSLIIASECGIIGGCN